jgi:hypothetical protein
MALLWIEGFEGFGTTTGGPPLPNGSMARKYPTAQNEFGGMDIVSGRTGGYALKMANNTYFYTPSLTTNDTMVCGCAFYNTNGGSDYTIMAFFDGSDKNINIRWDDGASEIDIWRENTLLETSSGLNLATATWYWVEMKAKTDNSTGTYDVELSEVSIFSASGVDTQIGSNAYSDQVRFFGATSDPAWDDIYILDPTGSENNDMLGNVKVSVISPDGDDTANWGTSSPSANHYENVNENPGDDDTSYVSESTANVTDLYDYEALPAVGDIFGIQINTVCRETDATSFDLITPIESGGTQYDDTQQAIGTTSWKSLARIAGTDPDTGNLWTESGVNSAKFGIKVG